MIEVEESITDEQIQKQFDALPSLQKAFLAYMVQATGRLHSAEELFREEKFRNLLICNLSHILSNGMVEKDRELPKGLLTDVAFLHKFAKAMCDNIPMNVLVSVVVSHIELTNLLDLSDIHFIFGRDCSTEETATKTKEETAAPAGKKTEPVRMMNFNVVKNKFSS